MCCALQGNKTVRPYTCAPAVSAHLLSYPCMRAMRAVFEVVQRLRLRGVGRQLQRCSWMDDSFWTLTAIQPALVRLLS